METKTHKFVTEYSINKLGFKWLKDNQKELIHYSAQPDFDENEGAFKYHFYNPATGKNFDDQDTSALSRFFYYYTLAEHSKNKGERKYIEYLGRSLHYLVDLNTPVHTYNQDVLDAVLNVSSHMFFEKKCDELLPEFDSSEAVKINNINYFTNNSIKNIGKNCALRASYLFDKYSHIKDKSQVKDIAIEAIDNSIKNVMGILYKFN